MPKVIAVQLSDSEYSSLQRILKYSADWRERERAQTILLLAEGLMAQDVANQQNLSAATVRSTRRAWFLCGIESLKDKVRIGAPPKISSEHKILIEQWAKESPLSARKIQEKLMDVGCEPVCITTVRAVLRQQGFSWKRTRLSLKNCAIEKFLQSKQQLTELQERARKGEIDLAYADESGFDQVSPNTNAWSPVGQNNRHLIDAKRGSRINIIGAIFSNGTAAAEFSDKPIKSSDFCRFLTNLAANLKKPLIVVLDNASIHKSKECGSLLESLEKKNLSVYFLPPYSPELNRIERLWHKIKYTWMSARRRTKEELKCELIDIFNNFGNKFNFVFIQNYLIM